MLCPVDNTVLQMTERQGVEIDYCPQCRGVWLDRGELDKIIDRSADALPATPVERAPDDRSYRDDRSSYSSDRPAKKKKKESFLGELFDF
jgi:Zn-finger nucleic acid-binding protein